MTDVRRMMQGAKAKVAGQVFEAMVVRSAAAYERMGERVEVTQNYAPTGGAPGRLHYKGRAPVDFTGTYRGRSLAFDAKTRSGKHEYLHHDHDMHQLVHLLRLRRAGAAVGIMVYCAVVQVVWLVTDIETLAAGKSVPLRAKIPGERSKAGVSGLVQLQHFQPWVSVATTLEVAQGKPEVPFLRLWHQAYPAWGP